MTDSLLRSSPFVQLKVELKANKRNPPGVSTQSHEP